MWISLRYSTSGTTDSPQEVRGTGRLFGASGTLGERLEKSIFAEIRWEALLRGFSADFSALFDDKIKILEKKDDFAQIF